MFLDTMVARRTAPFRAKTMLFSPRRIHKNHGVCFMPLKPEQPRDFSSGPSLLHDEPNRGPHARKRRIIVGMTGATGSIIGVRVLEALRKLDIETHLIMSKWAEATLKYETDKSTPSDIRALAAHNYAIKEVSAPISSGSFVTDGMVIVPCSMKTLAAVRIGYADDLISRAADVVLKERRRLVLVVRETPLSTIHLENMTSLSRSGAIIFPPVPAFYTKPETIDDVVGQTVGRILDMFHLDTSGFERWSGMKWK